VKSIITTLLVGILLISSCNNIESEKPKNNTQPMEKQPDVKTSKNRIEIVAPVVTRPLTNKKGVKTAIIEYYVQRSIKDYFVKFCESEVTQAQIEDALESSTGLVKTVRLEVEIKDGLWDDCNDESEQVQSRMGEYMVVYKVL